MPAGKWTSCPVAFALVAAACGPPQAPPVGSGPRSLRLLYTADLHSHLLGEDLAIRAGDATHGLGPEGETVTVGGVARIATLLAEARADGVPALYLDAGDLLEGTSFFPAFGGEPEMRVANALGVDAMAAGNHDLAFGVDALGGLRAEWARFPLLGANLGEEQARGLVLPVALVERAGVRVAVVGLGRRPDGVPNLAACARAVGDAVSSVRPSSDLVVLLSHLGRDLDLALVPRTTGIDVVIGGHTHDVIDPPATVLDCDAETARERGCDSHRVPVVHPGAYGRYVGRADFVLSNAPSELTLASSGGRSAVVDTRFGLLPVTTSVPERPDVVSLLAPYAAALDAAGVNRAIAFAPVALSRRAGGRGDSALGDLVTGAMLEAAAADVALVNTTGIRADVVAGPVSLDALVRVLPFEDDLVTVQLSGDALLGALHGVVAQSCRAGDPSPFQVAGARVAVRCTGTELTVEIGGQALDPARSYRVAAASFLVESGRWLSVPSAGPPASTGETVRDAVVTAVRGRSPCPEVPGTAGNQLPCLEAQADGRITWR